MTLHHSYNTIILDQRTHAHITLSVVQNIGVHRPTQHIAIIHISAVSCGQPKSQ